MLLARAKALGLSTLNGLGMLIYQAVFALEEFTDENRCTGGSAGCESGVERSDECVRNGSGGNRLNAV